MEIKKEFLKKIVIIIIVLIVVIGCFIFYKKEEEEFYIYDEIVVSEERENNENLVRMDTENFENKIKEINKIKIYITGEVNNPGVKELEDGSRIEDAIRTANGVTSEADISQVNLAYTLEDGQKIYIPNVNEKIDEYVTKENGSGVIEVANSKSSGRININKADINELCELPGVGESLASRIITYREENGKFKSTEDLKNVSGIGEKKFESLKQYIVVK